MVIILGYALTQSFTCQLIFLLRQPTPYHAYRSSVSVSSQPNLIFNTCCKQQPTKTHSFEQQLYTITFTRRSSVLLYSYQERLRNHNTPWTNITSGEDNVAYYLMVYGILAGCNTIFTLARAFLFAYGGICAATKIHRYLLKSILKVRSDLFMSKRKVLNFDKIILYKSFLYDFLN